MSKPGEAIWDWEVIKALYLGGMELKDIVQVPRFSKLGLKYLQNRASEEKWRASRDEARAEGTGQIAKGLIAKMAEAEHDHQEWLLETLKEERRAFDNETIKHLQGGKNQLERLKIINQLDETVRRQLGLDQRQPLSDQQRHLGLLISIQNGTTGEAQTIKIAALEGPNGAVRASRGELEAAEILKEYEREKKDEEPKKVLPPGIKPISPFKVKGEEPLVNEKPEEDLIDVINRSGQFHAFEISPGHDPRP
jgi:hypothetical protein